MPGTGWPEPGGFLPREALKLLGLVAAEGICGLEVVEVSPPYDTSDITALIGVRVVVEALGSLVAHGKLGVHKPHHRQAGQLLEEATCTRDTTHEHHQGNGASAGHNHRAPPHAAQWQTPHLPHNRDRDDITSTKRIWIWWKRLSSRVLRPAPIRPVSCDWRACHLRRSMRAGRRLQLLRVETDSITDVGSVTPHLGGEFDAL